MKDRYSREEVEGMLIAYGALRDTIGTLREDPLHPAVRSQIEKDISQDIINYQGKVPLDIRNHLPTLPKLEELAHKGLISRTDIR